LLASTGGWQVVESSQDGFFVALPGDYHRETERVDLGGEAAERVILSTAVDEAQFEVSFVDLPEKILEDRDADEILDAARLGSKTMDRMQITRISRLTISGCTAQRFRVTIPKVGVIHHQVVLWGNRLCHQVVVAPRGDDHIADIRRFFDSFTAPKAAKV
jgi:hypothetical protein